MKKFFMLFAMLMLLGAGIAVAADAPASTQNASAAKALSVKDLKSLPESELVALLATFTPQQICEVIAIATVGGDEALIAKVLACAESAINTKPAEQRMSYVSAINEAGGAEASEDEENNKIVSIVPIKKTIADKKDRDGVGRGTGEESAVQVNISALSGDGTSGFVDGSSTSSASGATTNVGNASAAARRK